MFLLIVEADNENHPVSLDDVAKDLVDEGFTIEKISKDGETRLIKVDLDSVERDEKAWGESTEATTEVEQSGALMKVRRKRTICLKCDLDGYRMRRHGHGFGRGHGCIGGCGGGFQYRKETFEGRNT
jgi:hypothetical protein